MRINSSSMWICHRSSPFGWFHSMSLRWLSRRSWIWPTTRSRVRLRPMATISCTTFPSKKICIKHRSLSSLSCHILGIGLFSVGISLQPFSVSWVWVCYGLYCGWKRRVISQVAFCAGGIWLTTWRRRYQKSRGNDGVDFLSSCGHCWIQALCLILYILYHIQYMCPWQLSFELASKASYSKLWWRSWLSLRCTCILHHGISHVS